MKMSDFLKDLGETISKTAQGISEKAGSVYESQKIRNKIATEERMIQKAMEEIGKWVYTRYKDGEEIDQEVISFCEEIRDHQVQIETYKEDAANRKGKKICPACKKTVDKVVSFCPFCGTPIPDPEPQEVPEDAFEDDGIFEDEDQPEKADEEAEESVLEAAEEAKEAACEAAEEVKEGACEAAEELKEEACEAAEEAKEGACETAEEVKECICEAAEEAVECTGETAAEAAEEIKEAAGEAGEFLKDIAEDVKDTLE